MNKRFRIAIRIALPTLPRGIPAALRTLVLVCLLLPDPVRGELFRSELEGYISGGYDGQNTFGIPGNDTYVGMPYKASWIVDTDGITTTDCGSSSSGCFGAGTESGSTIPLVKEMTLTINGITVAWPEVDPAGNFEQWIEVEETPAYDRYRLVSWNQAEPGYYGTGFEIYVVDLTGTMLSSHEFPRNIGPIEIQPLDPDFFYLMFPPEFRLPVPCVIENINCMNGYDVTIIETHPRFATRFSSAPISEQPPESKTIPFPKLTLCALSVALLSIVVVRLNKPTKVTAVGGRFSRQIMIRTLQKKLTTP